MKRKDHEDDHYHRKGGKQEVLQSILSIFNRDGRRISCSINNGIRFKQRQKFVSPTSLVVFLFRLLLPVRRILTSIPSFHVREKRDANFPFPPPANRTEIHVYQAKTPCSPAVRLLCPPGREDPNHVVW